MNKTGLTSAQAEAARASHGSNVLSEQKRETFGDKLLQNLNDPMIKILCVALCVNVAFAVMGEAEWFEPVGIAFAVAIAAFVSTLSEYRNENAFAKLRELASRISARVYRDGVLAEIPADDIVVSDVVAIAAGDKIMADGVVVGGTVKVDQSALNGESEEASKHGGERGDVDGGVSDSDTVNFDSPYRVYRGSVVCSGVGSMRVTSVGDNTVYGGIAKELQADTARDTPLKLKLRKLAKQISVFGYVGGGAIATAYIISQLIPLLSALPAGSVFPVGAVIQIAARAVILAVTIIVMAVPEGLPLMIALVSALNMGKMLKSNVLVRKIAGIETAGSLNILYSDKTGTITSGKLTAITFAAVGGVGSGGVRDYAAFADIPRVLRNLLDVSVRFNTTAVQSGSDVIGGNATERAALRFVLPIASGSDGSVTDDGIADYDKYKVVDMLPFNSVNKFSAARIVSDGSRLQDGSRAADITDLTLIKGAPEKLLNNCADYYDEAGYPQTLTAELRGELAGRIDTLAARSMRVIALATSLEYAGGELPAEMTLVGILGIRDEVRESSVSAIAQANAAGVQVVMITGDRKDTAVAIAREAGLVRDGDTGDTSALVLTSEELNAMSDGELAPQLSRLRVVARALPSDKSRLVRLSQEAGMVVGMTGDGVNDSPALKASDVGFAMGGGTEVAKEAGDIVILDDNFSSVASAILYGRTIFNSIRKFITFQLTINVAAVLISFIAPLIGIASPLSIIQILWVNLIMDTLAALAFGGEPALPRYMNEKPKRRDEPLVSPAMLSQIAFCAGYIVAASLVFLLTPLFSRVFVTPEDVMTGFFAFFIFAAIFNAFNARTEAVNLFDKIRLNKGFLKVFGLIAVIQTALVYVGGDVLGCHGLTLPQWGCVLALAFGIVPLDVVRKLVRGRGA